MKLKWWGTALAWQETQRDWKKARLAEQRYKEKGNWGEAREVSRGHAGPGMPAK